ncbi:TonB-dependent receptor [Sphingobium subterraneum]|uniref:Iron complex outermembrane receptor protein n=1 Tax=Sphingobium subterraneum TaxID=627688 RepID=A0A841J4H1_9SPHN|nr:TonB-dependent receptor [Sphingobium subterraneum]MBB6125232.1 iron complex outermembrane receptor protein [Sphingobium subterraneum]
MKGFLLSTVAMVLAVPLAAGAYAQTTSPAAGPAAATDQEQGGIVDIIVTAERRSSSVQATPIAISAVSGDSLREKHIADVESLSTNIPNLNFSRIAADARISIRGIGYNAIAPGGEPRVALYLDGVYQARNQAGFLGFYDVDRIEVLRGPQGTLYGRNAIAGTINILTRDPGERLNGFFTGSVGDYGLVGTEGAVGGPLSSTVQARIAFNTVDRNGYGKNITTGEDVNDEHSRSVRGKLKFEPSSAFTFTLIGDYSRVNDHSGGYRSAGRGNSSIASLVEVLGAAVPTEPQDAAGFGPRLRINTYGVSGQADLELSPDTKVTLLSSYRNFKVRQRTNIDGSAAELSKQYINEDSDAFSTELRLAQNFGDSVNLLVGGYYFHEKNTANNEVGFKGVVFSGALSHAPFFPPAVATAIANLDPNTLYEFYGSFGRVKTDAYAIFAQAHVQFTDQLALDLGGRYSNEKKSIFEQHQVDLLDPFVPFNPLKPGFNPALGLIGNGQGSQSTSWHSFDPKATISFKPAQGIYLYATYSRGFKAGGYNIGGIQPAFRPEKLTNYEIGLKTDLFDRKLRVNLAAFNYDYKDLQENIVQGIQLVTINAAKARVRGVEAEITARPTDALMIQINGAYLDGKYKNFLDSDPSHPNYCTVNPTDCVGGKENLAGNQITDAPKYQIGGEIGYTINTGFGNVTPRASVTWFDRIYFDHYNNIERSQPSRTMVNLYLGWESKDGSWNASAYIKNLTDDTYFVGTNTNADLLLFQRTAAYGPPRTFGLSVTKSF